MRLIDADELEKDAEWSEYEDRFISYSQMQIDNAPTIDAVPVVRCGNCINSKDGYTCCIGRGIAFNGNATFPNSYCDNGEKKPE